MPTVECKRKDCKYFGIDLCIKRRVHHDESGMCTDFEVNGPAEIIVRSEDLKGPFKSNCEKVRGVFRECKIKRVFK